MQLNLPIDDVQTGAFCYINRFAWATEVSFYAPFREEVEAWLATQKHQYGVFAWRILPAFYCRPLPKGRKGWWKAQVFMPYEIWLKQCKRQLHHIDKFTVMRARMVSSGFVHTLKVKADCAGRNSNGN